MSSNLCVKEKNASEASRFSEGTCQAAGEALSVGGRLGTVVKAEPSEEADVSAGKAAAAQGTAEVGTLWCSMGSGP